MEDITLQYAMAADTSVSEPQVTFGTQLHAELDMDGTLINEPETPQLRRSQTAILIV